MQLLVIRHAIAEERDVFAATGKDDSLRPLTVRGARKMKQVARGLRRVVRRIDLLAASPLIRAQQTADIVSVAYDRMPIVTIDSLDPESEPEALARWLKAQRAATRVAIVGHEPHLGMVVTWLMTGTTESRIALRKGGACLLDLPAATADRAILRWALTPSQLRRIGR